MKGITTLFFFILLVFQSSTLMAQREFTRMEGDSAVTMKRYVFMLLEAGPNRQQDSLSAARIQQGHMDHMSQLAAEGKLVMAGPFDKGDPFRGLFVMDVETLEEAEELVKSDPAISSGRLTTKTFFWWTAKGSRLP